MNLSRDEKGSKPKLQYVKKYTWSSLVQTLISALHYSTVKKNEIYTTPAIGHADVVGNLGLKPDRCVLTWV